MKRKEKLLLTFLLIGVLGGLAGLGIFGFFSDTTENTGNTFDAGTVAISDNDSNQALYNFTDQKPGGTNDPKCIQVTYTGSLDADVRLYTTSTIGPIGDYVNLTITPGTDSSPAFPDCSNFTPDAGGSIYSGTLAGFASAHNSYSNGLADYPGSSTAWSQGDDVVYQFDLSLDSSTPDSLQGGQTGSHNYTWEARNQ